MLHYDTERLLKRIAMLESQLREMDSTLRRGITGNINRSKTLSEEVKKEVLDIIWERKKYE